MPIVLVYDTETTGKPPHLPGQAFAEGFFNDKKVPAEQWPRIVQLAFILYDTDTMTNIQLYDSIIRLKDDQYPIPPESIQFHAITDEISHDKGIPIEDALSDFVKAFDQADYVVGHNIQYDINVVLAEMALSNKSKQSHKLFENFQKKMRYDPTSQYKFCTMNRGKTACDLPKLQYGPHGPIIGEDGEPLVDLTLDKDGKRKLRGPSLENSHKLLFQQKPNGQLHNALVDVAVSLRVYMMLNHSIDICSEESQTESNRIICELINPGHISKADMPRTIADEAIAMLVEEEEEPTTQMVRRSSPRLKSLSERLTIGDEATLLGDAATTFDNEDTARGTKKTDTNNNNKDNTNNTNKGKGKNNKNNKNNGKKTKGKKSKSKGKGKGKNNKSKKKSSK